MQVVALKPSRTRLAGMLAAVCALVALMALFPLAALPISLLLPLFICPLIGTKNQWAVIPGALAPTVIALLAGQPALYAFSLLFCGGIPAVATLLANHAKAEDGTMYAYFIGAYAFALALVLGSLQGLFPGRLAEGIARQVTDSVTASPDSLITLYRLAASGFISVPSGFEGRNLLGLMLDPGLTRQLSLSLHLTLSQTLYQLLPTLVVQICLLGGVFTALRVAKMNRRYLLVDAQHREPVKVALTPGFSLLRMPRKCGGALTAMGLMGMVLAMTESAWCQQLSALLFASFVGGYALTGAAAALRAFLKRWPQARIAAGVLVAILYVLFTTVLFLFGVLDALTLPGKGSQSKENEEDAR